MGETVKYAVYTLTVLFLVLDAVTGRWTGMSTTLLITAVIVGFIEIHQSHRRRSQHATRGEDDEA